MEKSDLFDEGVETIGMEGTNKGSGIEVPRDLEGLASLLRGVGRSSGGFVDGFGNGFDAFPATEVSTAQGQALHLFVLGSALAVDGEVFVVGLSVVAGLRNTCKGLLHRCLIPGNDY